MRSETNPVQGQTSAETADGFNMTGNKDNDRRPAGKSGKSGKALAGSI
ncbi:hypothetical protein [Bradyrhizobium guangdongense]|nr:hypothetical protein [Bradyrhizobium guangdongense]